MEVKLQRPAYYFSWPDEEILDEKFLEIPGDDETWLYRVDHGDYNGHFQVPLQPNHYHTPSGSVDSRTFTRRKHTLRPSLESVAETPLFNRSSLGILSASQLNDTKLGSYSITPISTSQGRIFSSFTASDKVPIPRVFKLDTPLMNNPFERKRQDSEFSDCSIIPSLDNQFDQNEAMTDSLVNFLLKPNAKFHPPADFQDEKPMTESLVSLSEKDSSLAFSEEAMTDSMVNFLEPVACEPPSGFGDEGMSNSIVNIDEKDILPVSDMTNSLINYLEGGNMKIAPLSERAALNEAENIPPERLNNSEEEFGDFSDSGRILDERTNEINTTFAINNEKDGTFDIADDPEKSPEITFTNNVNISRTNNREIINIKSNSSFNRPINTTFEKEKEMVHKLRALNNKDLNVTQDLNEMEVKENNVSKFKIPNKTNSLTHSKNTAANGTFEMGSNERSIRLNGTFSKGDHDSLMNGTFTKNNLNNPSKLSRQIPQRNSTFNTTFTKLDLQHADVSTHMVTRSTECLDAGVEDDRTSSASDSSFSSAASSNKPRSVDELRTIAQQQESNLQLHTSTPTESNSIRQQVGMLGQLDKSSLSPIRRVSLEGRRVPESRSAHSSPVRSSLPPSPIARASQPIVELRRQTLQASSLSNLSLMKPRASGLRMPQPTGRATTLVRPEPRPTTAPTAIPRPQASRLPMPRVRASGIPTMKRGGRY